MCVTVFCLVKFGKCAKKYYEVRTLFLYCTKRRSSQIKPQLKVKIEDWCKAPEKPSIYILCLSVCFLSFWDSVRLYPINVKTAEPIRPKIFCVTSKICLHQNSIFENIENPRNFLKNPQTFCFDLVLQWIQRKNVHNGNRR